MYSDNAKGFKALSRSIDLPWQFIPERSPWWGGWWERLVGTMKRALRKTLHRTSFHREELSTIIVEVEQAINLRPITYVSDQVDSLSALRPFDFLCVSTPLCSPWVSNSGKILGSRWRHRQLVTQHLQRRWRHEYLRSLRQWRGVDSPGRYSKPGDIVLVKDGTYKLHWPLARLVKVFPSARDGVPSATQILLRGKLTRRASQLLCPLEAEPPWDGVPPLRMCSETLKETVVPKPSVNDASGYSRCGRKLTKPDRLGFQ